MLGQSYRSRPFPVTNGRSSAESSPARRGADGRDRVHDAARGADDAGVALAGARRHLHVALVARRAGDDDAVAARADGLRPVGAQRRRRGA